MIERYMGWLFERGREKTSQARCLCGIRSFFNFLRISDQIEASPAEFVDTPKFGRHLPDILTTAEIDVYKRQRYWSRGRPNGRNWSWR